MAAMAGLLGVALEKEGAYQLGDARHALSPATIARASAIVILGASLTAGALAFAIGVRHVLAA
jgi:cobalamin biosynthesis protein CobD/CbiB